MIAGRTDLKGTKKAIIVVVQRGNPVPTVSGVGTQSYAQLPQQEAAFTSTEGWAAFRVTVP